MQSEEMKIQSGSACMAGYISREGYEALLRNEKAERLKMLKQSEKDIVGFLYDLPLYLDPESKQESREETRIYEKLARYLKDGEQSFDIQNMVLCLTNEYGVAAEESGFRRGFQVAMRLCMDGMRGGAGI